MPQPKWKINNCAKQALLMQTSASTANEIFGRPMPLKNPTMPAKLQRPLR